MTVVLTVGSVAVSTGVASAAPTARATPAAKGGFVHVYEVYPSLDPSVPGSDVLTGAITDYGQDDREVNGSATTNMIVLQQGSFEVDTSSLQQITPVVNPKTCSFRTGFTGAISIIPNTGTGLYAGIKGSVKVLATTFGVDAETSGTCDENDPIAGVTWLRGSGFVSYS